MPPSCKMPRRIVLRSHGEARELEMVYGLEGQRDSSSNGGILQHESYDHLVRDAEELERIIQYILNNPVKAGLVKDRRDWKWNYRKPRK